MKDLFIKIKSLNLYLILLYFKDEATPKNNSYDKYAGQQFNFINCLQ